MMIHLIDKKIWFYAIMFASFSLSISLSIIPYYYQTIEAQKIDTTKQEEEGKEKGQEVEENKCITYNNSENLISISCKNISFADISRSSSNSQLQDSSIMIQQEKQPSSPSTIKNNNEEKIWLLYAGIEVEKDASLDINSNDVRWLKIVPSKNTPNAITVDGSLKVDSVKITSWNPETNDYVKFAKEAKYSDNSNDALYTKVL